MQAEIFLYDNGAKIYQFKAKGSELIHCVLETFLKILHLVA